LNTESSWEMEAAFKRLGFLLEKTAPDETEAIEQCRKKAYSRKYKNLNPKLNNSKAYNPMAAVGPGNWKRMESVD